METDRLKCQPCGPGVNVAQAELTVDISREIRGDVNLKMLRSDLQILQGMVKFASENRPEDNSWMRIASDIMLVGA